MAVPTFIPRTADPLQNRMAAEIERLARIGVERGGPLRITDGPLGPQIGLDLVSALTALPPDTTISTSTLEFIDTTTPANFITVEAPTGLTPYTLVLPSAAGTANQVLDIVSVVGGVVTLGWVTPSSGFTNPMTTLGDIIYEDATPTAVRLAGNTTTTRKVLTQTGTGTISAVPAWSDPSTFLGVQGKLGPFPQWMKWRIVVNGANFTVTNPDGSTTNTALAASTTQPLTLTNPAPVAGTTVTAGMWSVPTAFTGLTAPTGKVGYTGGDTTGTGQGSNLLGFINVTGSAITLTSAETRRGSVTIASNGTPSSDMSPSNIAAWNLVATMLSGGGNWTAATAGEFDVWLLMGNAP